MNFNRATRLVLDVLRLDPPENLREAMPHLRPVDWRKFIALTRHQQVMPPIYSNLKKLGLLEAAPHEIRCELREAFLRNMARNLGLYDDLERISSWLRPAGIPAIVLKGAHLARSVYGNIALREMLDLDLLVPRAHLMKAYGLLEAQGYYPNPDDGKGAEERIRSHHHLIGLKNGSKHMVELHWHIEVPPNAPIEEFWERAVPFGGGKSNLLCFAPEDLLLHLCHHLSYQHRFSFGLRPLLDIVRVVEHFGERLDWGAIGERAERFGWSKGVFLALRVAQSLLGMEAPENGLTTGGKSGDLSRQEESAVALVMNSTSWSLVPPNLALVWQERSRTAKLGLMWQRIFIPAEQLAAEYPVDPRSSARYWYYLVRLKDLVAQNGWILGRRAELELLIRQDNDLNNWLEK